MDYHVAHRRALGKRRDARLVAARDYLGLEYAAVVPAGREEKYLISASLGDGAAHVPGRLGGDVLIDVWHGKYSKLKGGSGQIKRGNKKAGSTA